MNWVDIVPFKKEAIGQHKALAYIAHNLRALDREEIFATRWEEDPNQLALDCINVAAAPTSYTVLAYHCQVPVAVLGACEPWPGLWDVWCFGTEDFPKVARRLTEHTHRKMIPTLLARGARRAHCRSLATHYEAHNWLHSLGARQYDDRMLKGWGKNGQDFIMFEWHRDEMLQVYKAMEAA